MGLCRRMDKKMATTIMGYIGFRVQGEVEARRE